MRLTRLALFPVVLILLGIGSTAGQVLAQETNWSSPVLVFEGPGTVSWPSIVADVYGQVHAFWIFNPDASTGIEGRQVYYARLDRPDWHPVDILLSTESLGGLQAAANNSQLALLWAGGEYTSAGVTSALTARAWSAPESVAASYPTAGLAVAPDGALWMVYGDVSTQAVFVRKINSETGQWEPPLFVANVSSNSQAPDAPKIGFSSDNVIHVVWVEYQLPNGWPPTGVFYSRSSDGGQNWTSPHVIASGGYNQPNVIGGAGQDVYMTWVGIAGVGGKYFTQSKDKGATWSGTTALFPAGPGGSEGPPNMVLDSTGKLHLAFSTDNCVYYMAYETDGWTDPDCISRSVPSTHTEQPVMTIGAGNVLHVLWWTNDRQLWYMTRQLSAPGQLPLPTPTEVIPTPIPPTPVPTLVPTPTHIPDYGTPMDPELTSQAGLWSVLAGVVPVMVLMAIVYISRIRRN